MTSRRELALLLSVILVLQAGCVVGEVGGEEDEGVALEPDATGELERDTLSLEEEELPAAEEGGRDAFATLPALLDSEELDFLKRLNDYRAQNGKGKLRVSIALTRASEYHSNDMATKGYFSHTSKDGTSFADRVKRYYSHNTYLGENIAKGNGLYATGAGVFTGWKNSPGHNANMLSSNYRVIGIARVADANGVYYWTTDFGGYTDAILSAGLSTLVSNPGFESPTAVTNGVAFSDVRTLQRWHLKWSSGGSSAIRAGSASAGSYGLRQVDPDPGYSSATQLVRAGAGVSYKLSVATRRLAGPTQQLAYLDFLNSSYQRIKVVTVPGSATSAWQTVSIGEVSPSGTRYVRVIFWGGPTAGHRSSYDFDVVRLEAF